MQPLFRNLSISRRLFLLIALPVVLLVTGGLGLGMQIVRLSDRARFLDHSDATLAKLYEVQLKILDQETGLRGFLITGKQLFLQPYEGANVLRAMNELRSLIVANPEQLRRLQGLQDLYVDWLAASQHIARGDTPLDAARHIEEMTLRKHQMDDIRQRLFAMFDAAHALHRSHKEDVAAANRTTLIVFVGLFGAMAFFISLYSRRSVRTIVDSFTDALDKEQAARAALEQEEWVRTGQLKAAESLQGTLGIAELCTQFLRTLVQHGNAQLGALYVGDASGWQRRAIFGVDASAAGPEHFGLNEGLIGRAAAERVIREFPDVPRGYLRLRSGLGEIDPRHILFAPALLDDVVHAVVELGFVSDPDPRLRELLQHSGELLASAIRSADYRSRLKDLLDESQRQAEELQTQEEELRVTNEELQEQQKALREAHQGLEERKEELEVLNASLEAQTGELKTAQRTVNNKTKELERASRYKSEFLANMSHELRTPLNSSLILAKLLAENKNGNLDAEQVRYAETIYSAGNDLLTLINDVLDLAKIEAGRMDVHPEKTTVSRLIGPLHRTFEPLAREKKLALSFSIAEGLGEEVYSDVQRIQQILKNLLSNALKFTDKGEVRLRVEGDDHELHFKVEDSGIGIPESAQQLIFEAFKQVDGASNRKYGGTGLGLSISRDLARLLGGTLSVDSVPGKGSVFTLTLPRVVPAREPPVSAPELPFVAEAEPPAPVVQKMSPRSALLPAAVASERCPPASAPAQDAGRRVLLIVEDDSKFAGILGELARERDFQPVFATTADEAVQLAQRHIPAAVVLDVKLPDHSGLSVLDRLKRNPRTRHVPVHVISASDYSEQALAMGAVGYLLKPAGRDALLEALNSLAQRYAKRVRRVLLVEDDPLQQQSLQALLGGKGVELVAVGTVAEALVQLKSSTYDCIVTDLLLPDGSGDDLLEKMADDESYAFPPVIVYTGHSLSEEQEQRLRRHSSSIIVKGARSPERLLDELTLFLHQVEADLPAERQRLLKQARDREKSFEGRRILIAEDDVRNIFALSSILEPKGAKLVVARNGREALKLLESEPRIDLVLMDIMMPEMDGLTAIREIRKQPAHAKLPIVALTAKAMRDDQERCLQAGANDYAAKPIDVEVLLSLLRVWMPK